MFSENFHENPLFLQLYFRFPVLIYEKQDTG